MYYLISSCTALLFFQWFLNNQHKKLIQKKESRCIQLQKEVSLLQALIAGEGRERTRVAKELHDGAAGMLAAVKMHFSSIHSIDDWLVSTDGYKNGMSLLNEVTCELRRVSSHLMPEGLWQYGLDEAIRKYCTLLNVPKSCMVQYDALGEVGRLSYSFECSVFRMVKEVLHLIIRHTDPVLITVQLTDLDDILTVTIEEFSTGIKAKQNPINIEIKDNLQWEMKEINGSLELDELDPNGITVYMEWETELYRQNP